MSSIRDKKKTQRRRRNRSTALVRRHSRDRDPGHAYVMRAGKPEFVLVPVDEYEELIKLKMVQSAIRTLESAERPRWVDVEALRLQVAGDRVAATRKEAGLTQAQLGKKLGLPQSQISRIERNPDRTTVKTLKRIAKALGVSVSALV